MAVTGKIQRKYMAHYVNASMTATEEYERLGKDLEEYNVELNANVNTTQNILGETNTSIDGYEVSGSVAPYYAVVGSKLFAKLQDIIDNRKTLDDLKTTIVEAHLWEEPSTGTYVAYKEDAIIEVTSYGGDTSGYQIPFTLHHIGNRVKGKFDPKTLTFTADVGA